MKHFAKLILLGNNEEKKSELPSLVIKLIITPGNRKMKKINYNPKRRTTRFSKKQKTDFKKNMFCL
jgi:hypothetical protein